MKTIVLDIDNLRSRVTQLRTLQSHYNHCQEKLHSLCIKIGDAYLVDNNPVFSNEIDLSPSLLEISQKISDLANFLEECAEQIEYESKD